MGRPKARLSKGQPQGARSASGRKRERTILTVTPCEGVARRFQLYGVPANDTNTCDAIGRAYTAGLLANEGRGEERARELLNAARRICWQYWRIYAPEFGSPDSLARLHPERIPGKPMSIEEREEYERTNEEDLNESLAIISKLGRDVRAAFDTLVIYIHPDHGPGFLDAIVWAHKSKTRASQWEYTLLERAIMGLEAVA